MDAATIYHASSPPSSLHSGGLGSEFNKSSKSLKTSSGGDTLRDSESSGMILARYELDITFICEKLTNLNLLSMHVETKEPDFEAFVSDMNPDSVIKALEYALLSGFLDSEVRVLETHISDLQIEKANVREFLSSRIHLGEPLVGMEDMLCDSEISLEQSLEQVMEIKIRSDNFERNLLRFTGDKDYTESSNSSDPIELKENLKMQTVEHQRHILRMLDKSLQREIDLEKRVCELVQIEETLSMRLHLLEQEFSYAEEEAETTLENLYETNHTSDILAETSKELLSKIKMLQFNLKGSVQREAELKSSLLKLEERVAELELQLVNEKESTKQIVEMENTIKDLREQVVDSENKSQEVKETYEKVVLLEKVLSDANVKLQHAEASYEASVEEKNMFISTIKDMGNVIDDMKKKVAQAGSQTESMEDRCIFLSESNAELKKELNSVKGRVRCLETSLHQMEETKKASAKDISLRSKLIMDLVMQMALERERLQKQISSLKQENRILVRRSKKTDEVSAVKVNHGEKSSIVENDFTTENKEAVSTNFEVENECNETVTDSSETVRNIDVRQLKPKDILKIFLILVVPLFVVLLYQTQVR